MTDQFFIDMARKRKAAKEMLQREARVGTEWTAPGCGYSAAIVPSIADPDKYRIVWFDERGPSGDADRLPADVAEEIIMNFGAGVVRCDGAFDLVIKTMAAKDETR